ncbi:type III secretion system chaperone [Paracidovorax avenae]|uniref:type III secretion system chaperone n=1 Tax=Paracidovorax avenae TaxID=80867 RepID=UPI001AD80107|nr:type III secretion system chaperone [Paracidovorax avenae]
MQTSSTAQTTDPSSALSPASAAWLREAALQFGEPEGAERFARALAFEQDGIRYRPLLIEDAPRERWALVASQPCPAGVEEPVWTSLLLHLNAPAMALGSIGIGMDPSGRATVLQAVPPSHVGDAALLAQGLFQLSYFSGMLRESAGAMQHNLAPMIEAHALRQAGGEPGPEAAPPEMPPLPPGLEAATQARIDADWHRPLIGQALQELGAGKTQAPGLPLAGSARLHGTDIQIVACGDGHTLLLSALLDRPLADSAARTAALQANVELMVIAGCTLGLSPEGTLVQTRWDSTGMDGADLAVQLDGFAALAASMAGTPPPVQ